MKDIASKGLVTNYGEEGATKRKWEAREVTPLLKEGQKNLSHATGGSQKF